MRTVSVTELKTEMRTVLDLVEFYGDSFVVMRKGRPVAVIQKPTEAQKTARFPAMDFEEPAPHTNQLKAEQQADLE